MKSALEYEIEALLPRLRRMLVGRDRAVLLGVILCFVPFPPVCILGLLITVVNGILVLRGKLPRREAPLLLTAGLVSLLYLAAWAIAFHWLVRGGLPGIVVSDLHGGIRMLEGLFRGNAYGGTGASAI